MQSKISTPVSGAILVAALLLSGCKTTQTQISEHLPPRPAADLGPEFQVVERKKGSYALGETMDSAGRAHLIAALPDTEPKKFDDTMDGEHRKQLLLANVREVRHLVIGLHGVVSGEIMRHGVIQPKGNEQPESVDLAFDRAGNLHALINDEHLMMKDGAWVGSLRTPWKEANLNPRDWWAGKIAFVKNMPDLTWVFYVPDSDRRVWKLGFAGFVPVFFPDSEHVWQLTVVQEGGAPYLHWNALGMEDHVNIWLVYMAADTQNAIHALYTASPWAGPHGLQYATFRPDGKCLKPNSMPGAATDNRDTQKQTLALNLANGTPECPIFGTSVIGAPPSIPEQGIGPQIQVSQKMLRRFNVPDIDKMAFAMDPESGIVLMAGEDGTSMLVGHQTRSEAPQEMPLKNIDILLAPAGKNRFHALAIARGMDRKGAAGEPVYYLEYSDGAWSAPVEIGAYWSAVRDQAYRQFDPNRLFKIVSDNKGHALLVWPTKDALVGRWITLK